MPHRTGAVAHRGAPRALSRTAYSGRFDAATALKRTMGTVLVPVQVLGLAVDSNLQPVVLLTPLDQGDGPRTLVPIWIGSQEAASISMAISGEEPPRPLSHDLMQHLLEAVGASVDRADVTRPREG